MARKSTNSMALQKKTVTEDLLLKYYNRILLEEGLITEHEHRLMLRKIDARLSLHLAP